MNTRNSGPLRLRATGISSIQELLPAELDDATWRLRHDRYEFAPRVVHDRDQFFVAVDATPNIGEFSFGITVGS